MSISDILEELDNLEICSSTDSDIQTPEIDLGILELNFKPKMADFKPEYLNCVPHFDGNPNELNAYLSICESIINTFYDTGNPTNFRNIYIIHSLIGKLSGNAKLVVNIQNVKTWNELKNTLYRNFADQRDEACLNRDLVLLRQRPNEKPQQFYDRCLEILNLLCNYVDMHEPDDASKNLKRNLYYNLGLKTFISGLKEPLGTTIRCMKPENLGQAIQYVIKEDNIRYFQNLTDTSKSHFKPTPPHHKPQPIIRNSMGNVNLNPFPNWSTNENSTQSQSYLPPQQFPIQSGFNRQSSRYPTNYQGNGTYRPNQNVFRSDPRKPLPQPTPMSISTRNTYLPRQSQPRPPKNFNNQSKPPFTFEELYNAETECVEQQNLCYEHQESDVNGGYEYKNEAQGNDFDELRKQGNPEDFRETQLQPNNT